MAVTMVAMTARSKNRVLSMEKKEGWSIQLPEFRFPWVSHEDKGISLILQGSGPAHGGLFASVGLKVSTGAPAVAPSPGDKDIKIPFTDHCMKYVSETVGYQVIRHEAEPVKEEVVDAKAKKAANKRRLKLKVKIGNPHFRRLVSGAVAGTVSRTCVAPLETIRTHLMVGSNGDSMTEVFRSIMNTEGWTGLFRGNLVNVIRVAPSKAIELFAFDTAKKFLTPKADEPPKTFLPPSLVAGALAGVSSTLCTYPLELIKTRLTIEKDVYNNFLHAFIKILREEGPSELYRGLTPSLIGVVPYAAINYYAYDTLKKLYRKAFKLEEISNVATLLIGSAAGAISSTATFPSRGGRQANAGRSSRREAGLQERVPCALLHNGERRDRRPVQGARTELHQADACSGHLVHVLRGL